MKTEKEKMLAGELYAPSDPELVEIRRGARLLYEELNRTSKEDREKRSSIVRKLFGSTGEKFDVNSRFTCDYGENIHVGENFYTNFDCVILDVAEVRIGKNCLIAPQVGIYTATHPIDPAERYSGKELGKPITIGDNCWIGGHAVINPGVTLGNNVIVASGSVVTRSFGDNIIIGGNPAKLIREIPAADDDLQSGVCDVCNITKQIENVKGLNMKSTTEYWNPFVPQNSDKWEEIDGFDGQLLQLTLAEDPESGDYTRLTKFGDGCSTQKIGPKSHDYPEEIFIVSGRLYDEAFGIWLETGDYASRPPGEVHGPFTAECEVVVLEISYPSQSIN